MLLCTICKIRIPDDSAACSRCGTKVSQILLSMDEARRTGTRLLPNLGNNIPRAVISVFLCLPIGIIALIYALQVDGRYAIGDYGGAYDFAGRSRI